MVNDDMLITRPERDALIEMIRGLRAIQDGRDRFVGAQGEWLETMCDGVYPEDCPACPYREVCDAVWSDVLPNQLLEADRMIEETLVQLENRLGVDG